MRKYITALKPKPPRMPREQLHQLRVAIEAATFANYGGVEADKIREATRVYRETWILPSLRAVLDWGEGK